MRPHTEHFGRLAFHRQQARKLVLRTVGRIHQAQNDVAYKETRRSHILTI